MIRWRKSGFSGPDTACVELGNTGAVRDSKNPAGPILAADTRDLITAIKAERVGQRRR